MAYPLVVVAGPTAAGKSELAFQLAQEYQGEIISADSMQIYRHLDIGTAKPSLAEQELVPHHLIDVAEVQDDFSVFKFCQLVDQVVPEIIQRGHLPIVVGGTGFYVKVLLGLQPLDFGPSDPQALAELSQRSLPELQALLKETPATNLDRQNRQRLIRAIQIQNEGQANPTERPQYEYWAFGVDRPRPELYDRINQRVLKMMAAGLEDEARWLFEMGGPDLQAGKAIGYREFFPYFEGERDLETVVSLIQRNSRRYAKRQLTYWRHQIPGLQWVDAQDSLKAVGVVITAPDGPLAKIKNVSGKYH
ncbi:tRNA (adenosine(37)-N6)-dimethylallyltransferase MiaA [Leuconostocaceae bacterium ESL0723]|nr:tRNA (adenosine(37)-N6)-dimethylallyltransferase MiaA [Leuconostocaceae bacterium ESL0723]